MTVGVYKLTFKGTDKVYIGQSKNIEHRLQQHRGMFKYQKASIKLQDAYNTYGMPILTILEETTEELLDKVEEHFILSYNSVEEGFNTRSKTTGGVSQWGASNGRAIYSNEQIIECLFLLIQTPNLTYPIIQKKTEVLRATIVDIANGTGHTWLSRVYPEEYKLLMSFRNKRNTRHYKKAVSPTGQVFEVTHLSKFCIEHNLSNGNMSKLLRGLCNSYNGWTTLA